MCTEEERKLYWVKELTKVQQEIAELKKYKYEWSYEDEEKYMDLKVVERICEQQISKWS